MKTPVLLGSTLLTAACASTGVVPPEVRARELAQSLLVLDGHVDVPYRLWSQRGSGAVDDVLARTGRGDFDLPRAREGGLDAPFFSIYVPSEEEAKGTARELADELIDMVESLVERSAGELELVWSAAETRAAVRAGRLAILLGMENGSPIEGDLANLEHFRARRVRYVTLCHGQDNHICDSSYDTRHTNGGLSLFGREVVGRMNELGILIDVSHVSDSTFWQVMEITRAPVIASHSSLRHFVPGFERNLSDDMVRRIGQNGGVVQINFGSAFLMPVANAQSLARYQAGKDHAVARGVAEDSPDVEAFLASWDLEHPVPFATLSDVADHVERVVELTGVDHVGFGSDFDGVGDSLPVGLKDVSQYPNLLAELLRRGWSERDLAKLCGENVLRVMAEAEGVAIRRDAH
jgi:membrane dipeptidase